MFEEVDKVVYINLEERPDRRIQVEKELSVFPSEKVVRFNAIKQTNGALGASMSHIAVVEMAIQNNWKNVLIVEDDMTWNKFDGGYAIYKKLVSNPFDVLILGGACVTCSSDYKAEVVSTATAYIVKNHYFKTLLETFKEGLEKFINNQELHHKYALDRIWMKLMAKDNWYIVHPPMCVQRPGYSNIENKFTNYSAQFGLR